jgi:hypothetical protein
MVEWRVERGEACRRTGGESSLGKRLGHVDDIVSPEREDADVTAGEPVRAKH